MAGLSANVTLGPGVVPIPGQVNIPAGPDEPTFSDAFAEAQSARLDNQTSRDSQALNISSPSDGAVRFSAASRSIDRSGAPSTGSPIWQPLSRAAGSSRADLSGARPADSTSAARRIASTVERRVAQGDW